MTTADRPDRLAVFVVCVALKRTRIFDKYSETFMMTTLMMTDARPVAIKQTKKNNQLNKGRNVSLKDRDKTSLTNGAIFRVSSFRD